MSTNICSTNLSKGSFQCELPGDRAALEDSLGLLTDHLHHDVSLLVLLNGELTKPTVKAPALPLSLDQSSVDVTTL